MRPNPPKVVVFLGTAGSGKSWALGRVLKYDRARPQIVLLRWPDPSILRHVKGREYHISEWYGGRIRIPPKGRHFLYIAPLAGKELKSFQDSLVFALMELPQSVLAIDEAHILLERGSVSTEMIRLVRGSRHWGVTLYIATQRLVDIHPSIRSVITDLFIFKTTSAVDIAWLEAEGIPVAGVDRLGTGRYIYVSWIKGTWVKT